MAAFCRQLGWELYRLYARKRSYIGFGVFLLFELAFFFMFTFHEEELQKWLKKLSGAETFFSALTFGFMIVQFTMLLLGVTFVALVAGDIVAKETEDGNLRLLLTRPVSRLRLLVIKFLACQVYTSTLFVFVGATALFFGILNRGWGGGFLVWAPELPQVSLFDWNEGMIRYFAAILGFSFLYLPATGIAFFLSCLKIKPAAATILTIAIIISDLILSSLPFPFIEDYQEYFLSSRMRSWLLLLYQDIPWARLIESAAWLIGIGLTAFVLGAIFFTRRDIKS